MTPKYWVHQKVHLGFSLPFTVKPKPTFWPTPKNFAWNPVIPSYLYCYFKALCPLMAFQRVGSLVLKDIPSCKTCKRLCKRFKAQSQRKNLQLYKRKCFKERKGNVFHLMFNKENLSFWFWFVFALKVYTSNILTQSCIAICNLTWLLGK